MSHTNTVKLPHVGSPAIRRRQSQGSSFKFAQTQLFIWSIRSQQSRAFAELDERILKDIGMTRFDALHESRKPFWKG